MKQPPQLTVARAAVARAVADYRDRRGFGPEVPEIADITGFSIGKVRNQLNWLRSMGIVTFLPWNDEHHWRSFDRGAAWDAVMVRGEQPRRQGHKVPS